MYVCVVCTQAEKSLKAAPASFNLNTAAIKPSTAPPQKFVTSAGAPQWRQYATVEGRKYYHNLATCTSQWDPPPGESADVACVWCLCAICGVGVAYKLQP